MIVHYDRLLSACREARSALEFFDRVKAASEEEKIAVGTDHWNWMESALRRCAAAVEKEEE